MMNFMIRSKWEHLREKINFLLNRKWLKISLIYLVWHDQIYWTSRGDHELQNFLIHLRIIWQARIQTCAEFFLVIYNSWLLYCAHNVVNEFLYLHSWEYQDSGFVWVVTLFCLTIVGQMASRWWSIGGQMVSECWVMHWHLCALCIKMYVDIVS